ncbi:hypothetical protein PVAP13_5KG394807 [Panicum virgatum]|uniref:Uncharacterized protein n=1 Tax=Panicum virgatum TaxID=38727 RepID=A0A8T0SJY4_PANVG|nr:hypothetical protein PVAP13_5KG394807 [Panicum virgatum]
MDDETLGAVLSCRLVLRLPLLPLPHRLPRRRGGGGGPRRPPSRRDPPQHRLPPPHQGCRPHRGALLPLAPPLGLHPSRPRRRRRRRRARPRPRRRGARLPPGPRPLRAPRRLAGPRGRRLRSRLPRRRGRRGPPRGAQRLLPRPVARPLRRPRLRGPRPPLDRPLPVPGHVRRRPGSPEPAGARHCPLLRAGPRPPRRHPTLPCARDPRVRAHPGLPEIRPHLVGEPPLRGDLEVDAQRGAP